MTGSNDAVSRFRRTITLGEYIRWLKWAVEPAPIPEGAMRVAPGSDAVVWKISPEHCGEL